MNTALRVTILLCLRTMAANAFKLHFPERNTAYGTIRGKVTSRYREVEVEEYLGVPYAAPPVGTLRFKRPQPPSPWHGQTLQTTSLPPACPTALLDYIQKHKPTFDNLNEDCLFLNVYVPRGELDDMLPVFLFIHGGSNADGMGAMFDGDILAAHGKMIVVTFNYRTSVLGFYANPTLGIKGNNGLMDQVFAMKWVQENIGHFGGDKTRVTLHGHSAGAGDVGLHLLSNLSAGMFQNVVIHSGSPLGFWLMSSCVANMRERSKPKSCKDGFTWNVERNNAAKELLNGTTVNDVYSSFDLEKYEDVYGVVVDGEFLTDSPDKLFSCGRFNAHNVLLIMAKDEDITPDPKKNVADFIREAKQVLFIEETDTFDDDVLNAVKQWELAGVNKHTEYTELMSDINIFAPMLKLADILTSKDKDVYLLSFDYLTEHYGSNRVQHGWDLYYVFGVPLLGHERFPYSQRDAEVSKETMTIISDFVKNGQLIFHNRIMGRYNRANKSYNTLDYVNGSTIVTEETGFRKERIDFWNTILYAYDEFHCT